MTQAFVEPDPQHPFGHAVMRIPGAAVAAGDPRFLIRRPDHEKGVLGPAGWQAADAYLAPLSAEIDGDNLILHLGPAVVDFMDEPGTVEVRVPSAGFDGVMVWPDTIAPSLSGHSTRVRAVAVQDTIQREDLRGTTSSPPPDEQQFAGGQPPIAETAIQRPPGALDEANRAAPQRGTTPADDPRRAWRWRLAAGMGLLLLILAGAAGGAWWFQQRQSVVAQGRPAGPVDRCRTVSPQQMQWTQAETCLPPERLLSLARGRLAERRCADAYHLLVAAAQHGSAPAACELARALDPLMPRSDCFQQPIVRDAAMYYKKASDAGSTACDADRDKLGHALAGGDSLDRVIYKQFWRH